MDWRRFLVFDRSGALVSLGADGRTRWLLEDAYEAAGPWLTALGVVAIAGVAIVIGRALTREEERRPASARRFFETVN